MIKDQSYRKAFYIALGIHFLFGFILFIEPKHDRPVMHLLKSTPGMPASTEVNTSNKMIKAVNLDNQEVMKTVAKLKQERQQQLKAEKARQQALLNEAEKARKARLHEQQRLARMKEEAEKIAVARKKQMEEEQRRLQQLVLEKQKEAKRLEELKARQDQLKKKQQEEAKKLEELQKKQEETRQAKEKKKLEDMKKLAKAAEEVKAAKAAALASKQRQLAAQQAREKAAREAQLAGEVNKYKVLIVNAIGRQWILPENVDNNLSSQFSIRLAPNGDVLEVRLTRSSGNPILDRSAQTAIYKASPLPVPSDPATFDVFRTISLTVRPENVRG